MNHTRLGNTLEVSSLGLGCMGMSEFYGQSNDADSLKVLHQAVDLGIDFFDTADVYGPHRNEELVGRFLREHGQRDKLAIATKCGIVRSSDPHARALDSSPDYIRSACEASLRRLGIECIDLYYLHRYDGVTPSDVVMDTFAELQRAGKIRHAGLCEVSAATLRSAHACFPVNALQSEYSLWTRDIEAEILPACRELGIGLVPYSPLGRGFLTGTFTADTEIPASDFRAQVPRFQSAALATNLNIVEAVKAVASKLAATPAQIAIAWLLRQYEHTVPIPGTRTPRYLQQNVEALSVDLPADALQELDSMLARHPVTGERYGAAGMATLEH